MEPGYIPALVGGLGNQLFILAAAWTAAKRHGAPLYLLTTPPENPHSRLDYPSTIFKGFGALPLATLPAGTRIYKPLNGYAAWDPADAAPGSLMDSYFQYWPALAPVERELRAVVHAGLPLATGVNHAAAFLHIRRGDYVARSHVHFLQPMAYYQKATMRLLDAATSRGQPVRRIYVVTDDPAWAKAQEFFQDSLFEVVEGLDELATLALMASCKAGAILSNSTFSWWGAFLGPYESRAPVYIPPIERWISDGPVPNLCPPEWIQLRV